MNAEMYDKIREENKRLREENAQLHELVMRAAGNTMSSADWHEWYLRAMKLRVPYFRVKDSE